MIGILADSMQWIILAIFVASAMLAYFDFFAGRRPLRAAWPWLMLFSGSFLAVYTLFFIGNRLMPGESTAKTTPQTPVVAEKRVQQPLPAPEPKASPVSAPVPDSSQSIVLSVPFTAQAPFGNWADLRQEDGCEEASTLMVMRWIQGRDITPAEAEKEIIAISEYELATYGIFKETSVRDTADRILRGYFKYEHFDVRYNIGAEDIKAELQKGNAVIVPVNGQKLANPFYTPPGPRDHMLVVRGYDPKTKEFITNDPGTKRGEKFRYPETMLENALQDYPTGDHEPIPQTIRAMISVRLPS